MFEVEYKTLSYSDSSNKYFFLSGTPLDSTVALDTISGTAQAQLGDFAVDGSKISWGGYDLDGQLSANDIVRVIYDRS